MNTLFFSLRFLKSNLDVLTQPLNVASTNSFVRKQAAINLLKIVAGTAGVLKVADWVKPGSVEWDPRSSDFGKIKIDERRYDVSGGMSSLLVLAARMAALATDGLGFDVEGHTKSKGVLRKLNEKNKDGSPKYGARTGLDVIHDFLDGKLSPLVGGLKDLARGERFGGKPANPASVGLGLVTPISVDNLIELMQNDANSGAEVVASLILDAVGIGVSDYGQ